MALVSTGGLEAAHVLCALYNAGDGKALGIENARNYIEARSSHGRSLPFVDRLHGRVIKADLEQVKAGSIDTRLYDRDNGAGAGERAIRAFESGLVEEIVRGST